MKFIHELKGFFLFRFLSPSNARPTILYGAVVRRQWPKLSVYSVNFLALGRANLYSDWSILPFASDEPLLWLVNSLVCIGRTSALIGHFFRLRTDRPLLWLVNSSNLGGTDLCSDWSVLLLWIRQTFLWMVRYLVFVRADPCSDWSFHSSRIGRTSAPIGWFCRLGLDRVYISR